MGLWALRNVDLTDVGLVFAGDQAVREECAALGIGARVRSDPDPGSGHRGIGISVHYPKVLTHDQIAGFDALYNLHPGYLPWGRGYYPVFWALWEGSPAGCTFHEVVEHLDRGPIVDQIQVPYSAADTGGSLFARVRQAERELFIRAWGKALDGSLPRGSPQTADGTYHTKRDFFALKRCEDWSARSGEELLRLIRCLTFPGVPGLEIESGGSEFEVSLRPLQRANRNE